MQWSMRIGTFLETRKLTVEGTCGLHVAIYLTFLQIRNIILARKALKFCGNMQYIISFDEDEP